MSKLFRTISTRIKKRPWKYILIAILLSGVFFRTFNLEWDSGSYFHPDERAIYMFVIPLGLPTSFTEFLSPQSPLNPHFFAYGNFPLYLLKGVAELLSIVFANINQYGSIHIVGRTISALFDTMTILLVFLLGRKLKNKTVGLLSAFCYSLFIFPIQASHYFAVDTILTFFLIATLLTLVYFTVSPSLKRALLLGLLFGLALATKISGLICSPLIGVVFLLLFFKKFKVNKIHSLQIILYASYFCVTTIIIFFLTQPYALIDNQEFIKQTTLQSQMSKDPFIFPYTLQYVGKIPYLYELVNITFFGIGLPLSIICLIGILKSSTLFVIERKNRSIPMLITLLFFWLYFAAFGSFAVGWMRYMLPIYPILALGAGFFLEPAWNILAKKNRIVRNSFLILFVGISIIYPLSYLAIYQRPNTRILASEWINANIPHGSKIAIEHWDDGLPTFGYQFYEQLTLPLYEQDTPQKWEAINATLASADYIILASNRLYIPLQKLTDCNTLPLGKCYPLTSVYYKNLFEEKLNFQKVAEFESPPTIPFVNIKINDQWADESFTVNDHPKVIIFKRK